MPIVECVQGTAEWLQARAGHVTASRLADVCAKSRTRGAESITRRNYMAQIVAEILSGASQEDGFSSRDTRNGTEQEPFARAAYEITRDVAVEQVGFVLHPSIPRYGASPDGLIGSDGLIELKCPKVATHIQYLLDGVAPAEYHLQMLAGMDCCERLWCDFVSYCHSMPEHLQLFVVRFPRDGRRIAEVQDEVMKFNAEVDVIVGKLWPMNPNPTC